MIIFRAAIISLPVVYRPAYSATSPTGIHLPVSRHRKSKSTNLCRYTKNFKTKRKYNNYFVILKHYKICVRERAVGSFHYSYDDLCR